MKNQLFKSLRQKLAASILISLSAAALAQAVPGTPDSQPQQPRRGGGFGISINLGSLIKAVSDAAIPSYSSPDTSNQPQYEPRQVILAWLPANEAQASTAIQASGGNPTALTNLPNLGIGIAVLEFATQPQADAALASLQSNPALITSRHARAYPMQQTGTPSNARQYAHEMIKAPAAPPRLNTNISVGIIDTEVSNQAALVSANFKAKRFMADNEKASSNDHGSAVAAIIAGSGLGFEGLAQGASLRSAGVMREIAPGINATNTLLVAQALDWMLAEKVQVVNMSLGAADDQVFAAVIKRSLEAGIIIVAAAGNGGPQAAPSFPAAYPGVIGVTAIDAKRSLYTRANRGNYIAIAAPGVDVWIPVSSEAGKGKYMSGTSFAAPFVAGAVARSISGQAAGSAPVLRNLCSKAENLNAASQEAGCGLLQY
jgi:subtilisin family serine protease